MAGNSIIETQTTAGVLAPPPLLALAAVLLGLALDWLLPAYVLTVLLDLTERIAIGVILFGAAAALAIPAIVRFRAAGTHVEPWKPSTVLVTAGVFGWLRNPMYVGIILGVSGLAMVLASDWMLVMTVLLALVLHFGVVKREERYLSAKFGEPYRRYMATVPRYGWPF
jgi:protein-S-isoprenylcysteine O-methyltransferase Ste14